MCQKLQPLVWDTVNWPAPNNTVKCSAVGCGASVKGLFLEGITFQVNMLSSLPPLLREFRLWIGQQPRLTMLFPRTIFDFHWCGIQSFFGWYLRSFINHKQIFFPNFTFSSFTSVGRVVSEASTVDFISTLLFSSPFSICPGRLSKEGDNKDSQTFRQLD